jgi:hypothetical protein
MSPPAVPRALQYNFVDSKDFHQHHVILPLVGYGGINTDSTRFHHQIPRSGGIK